MAALNYSRLPGPGDFSPADDDFSDVRWQDAVCAHAEKLQAQDMVSEVIDALVGPSTWIAIHNAIAGRALTASQRNALVSLEALCGATYNAVANEYRRAA